MVQEPLDTQASFVLGLATPNKDVRIKKIFLSLTHDMNEREEFYYDNAAGVPRYSSRDSITSVDQKSMHPISSRFRRALGAVQLLTQSQVFLTTSQNPRRSSLECGFHLAFSYTEVPSTVFRKEENQ